MGRVKKESQTLIEDMLMGDAHAALRHLDCFREPIPTHFPIFEMMPVTWVSQLMNGLEMSIFDKVFAYFESVPDAQDKSDFPDMPDDTDVGARSIPQASEVETAVRERLVNTMLEIADDVHTVVRCSLSAAAQQEADELEKSESRNWIRQCSFWRRLNYTKESSVQRRTKKEGASTNLVDLNKKAGGSETQYAFNHLSRRRRSSRVNSDSPNASPTPPVSALKRRCKLNHLFRSLGSFDGS